MYMELLTLLELQVLYYNRDLSVWSSADEGRVEADPRDGFDRLDRLKSSLCFFRPTFRTPYFGRKRKGEPSMDNELRVCYGTVVNKNPLSNPLSCGGKSRVPTIYAINTHKNVYFVVSHLWPMDLKVLGCHQSHLLQRCNRVCGHDRSFPPLPGSRLMIFLSRCKYSTLTIRQPMGEFYLLAFSRFPPWKKKHKSYIGKNRTHDFRTS